MTDTFKIYAAPVQGHTDAAWRSIHAAEFRPAPDAYFTPFIRLEKGAVRPRDLADLNAMRDNVNVIPQVIFRDAAELRALIQTLHDAGERAIDVNMGCPFPLQTARGRGAAVIANSALMAEVKQILDEFADITFTAKMRLGFHAPDEWKSTIAIIDSMPLAHLCVHPRYAKQQYTGEPDLDAFAEITQATGLPLIYNGDLRSPADIDAIQRQFPSIAGVMLGRGLSARPSLVEEVTAVAELPHAQRIERMMQFHAALLDHYRDVLCGDGQILSKIKPFWEYAEAEIGRKAWKAIKKATTMPKYLSAVALVRNQ